VHVPNYLSITHSRIDKAQNKSQNSASFVLFFGVFSLANTVSAKKRAKQAVIRRERNVSQKSTMRTAIKKVLKAIQGGDKATAQATYKEVVKLADKAVNKRLVHANKASRIKSRLNQRIKATA